MANKKDWLRDLAAKWQQESWDLERLAKREGYTLIERKQLEQHALVKHACSEELKIELNKVRRE